MTRATVIEGRHPKFHEPYSSTTSMEEEGTRAIWHFCWLAAELYPPVALVGGVAFGFSIAMEAPLTKQR
jgi:hypothetical protein